MLGCPECEQRLEVGILRRHHHAAAYATIVLQGGYIERGNAGRWTVEPGHIVAHGMFEGHDNQVLRHGTRVVNIVLPPLATLPPVFTVEDPDALVAAARRRSPDIADLLRPNDTIESRHDDWPDRLAARLSVEPFPIASWAREAGSRPRR